MMLHAPDLRPLVLSFLPLFEASAAAGALEEAAADAPGTPTRRAVSVTLAVAAAAAASAVVIVSGLSPAGGRPRESVEPGLASSRACGAPLMPAETGRQLPISRECFA